MLEEASSNESIQGPRSEFVANLEAQWKKGNFVCVGLDTESLGQRSLSPSEVYSINLAVIDATDDLVCSYKPNIAFYLNHVQDGLGVLQRTINHIKSLKSDPRPQVILDIKADVPKTSEQSAKLAFDTLGADAVTVNPYFGFDAVEPFIRRKDKGVFVVVRSSNPKAGEFQDLPVGKTQEPLYQYIARRVAESWNENGNVGMVAGATYPEELDIVRKIVGDMPILIPGVGRQGGKVEEVVPVAKDSRGWGMVINVGLILEEGNITQAARDATLKLREEINRYTAGV